MYHSYESRRSLANVRRRIKEEQTKYRLSKEIEQELVDSSPWCGERDDVEDMVVVVYIMEPELSKALPNMPAE